MQIDSAELDDLHLLSEKLKSLPNSVTTTARNELQSSRSRILLLTVQSINSMEKHSALRNYLILNEIEIAILTETWRDSSTMSDNFNLFGQHELVSRVDRLKGQLGGVAVLRKASSDLVTRQLNILKNEFGTEFAVDNSSEALVFMCVYLPPSSSKYRVPPDKLELFNDSCLKNMNRCYPKEKFSVSPFLPGDFNLPANN